MSAKLVCDCDCHDDGYVIEDDAFVTFDDRDVCQGCLDYCKRWQGWDPSGRVVSQMELAFQAVYAPVIEQALRSGPLFRKMAKP